MSRKGWREPGPEWSAIARGKFSHWRHSSGWQVIHCGHPTAVWPFELRAPADSPLAGRSVISFNGLGFETLHTAVNVVERIVAGELVVTTDRCVDGAVARVLVDAAGSISHHVARELLELEKRKGT